MVKLLLEARCLLVVELLKMLHTRGTDQRLGLLVVSQLICIQLVVHQVFSSLKLSELLLLFEVLSMDLGSLLGFEL